MEDAALVGAESSRGAAASTATATFITLEFSFLEGLSHKVI